MGGGDGEEEEGGEVVDRWITRKVSRRKEDNKKYKVRIKKDGKKVNVKRRCVVRETDQRIKDKKKNGHEN